MNAFAPQPAVAPFNPRVLIVDDADDDREMYATFLAAVGGCRVTQAANGRDALSAIGLERPDVIVLDVMLPDLDGVEVCRQFRTTPDNAKTAVVAVTALPLKSLEVDRLISAGTDSVLLKPCTPDALLEEIRSLADRSRALRQRAQREQAHAEALRARSIELQERVATAHRGAREMLQAIEIRSLVRRVKTDYVEMPGLVLTAQQARRLWGTDEAMCNGILDGLVAEGFLICAEGGRYRRPRVDAE
jgi:DNA-binding response OmpR family regulator